MKAPNKYGALLHAPKTETCLHNYHNGCARQHRLSRVHEEQPSYARPLSSPIPVNKTRFRSEQVRKEGHSDSSLQPVRTEFRKGGFNYRKIAREGDWAIYEKKWRNNDNVAYEVVKIRPGSGLLAGREIYPSPREWGTYAFTVTDRDAAFKKLEQLSPGGPAQPTGTARIQAGTGTNTN